MQSVIYFVYDNPEHTAFKIINRYIRFVDKDENRLIETRRMLVYCNRDYSSMTIQSIPPLKLSIGISVL